MGEANSDLVALVLEYRKRTEAFKRDMQKLGIEVEVDLRIHAGTSVLVETSK